MNVLSLLCCPKCHSRLDLAAEDDSKIQCSCGETFRKSDGILNLVTDRSDTALDPYAYDLQKNFSPESSRRLFLHLKAVAGDHIPDHLGNVAEIGAGSGYLTVGMLEESEFNHAIISDISLGMLRLCSSRLDNLKFEKKQRVAYVASHGDDSIFAPGQLDLVIANSVLHHILDYRQALKSSREALRQGGRAVFVEPGAVFHDKLTLAMLETIAIMTARAIYTEEIKPVSAWVLETRHRMRLSPQVLANFEDKHIFYKQVLIEDGSACGFSQTICLPFDPDQNGNSAAICYLQELGIEEVIIQEFMIHYRGLSQYHFRDVEPPDMSGMYLLVFAA